MDFLLIIIIAISLSMDAFSLSLAYGTLGMKKKQIYLLSLTVGLFHFFMPLIGLFIGNKLFKVLNINPDFLLFIILTIIGIDMIYETFKKEENIKIIKKIEYLIFAFAVSIDSFSVGITLTNISSNYILSALTFACTSAILTLIGLLLGNKIKKSVGKISTVLGGIVLIAIGISYVL